MTTPRRNGHPKMTPEEARSFKRFSVANAMILTEVCGRCRPYQNWFTYKRWRAQGEQVAKGQHGTHLTVIVETEEENGDGKAEKVKFPWTSVVFCQHQLAKS